MEEKYVNPINYKKLCENIKSLMRGYDNMKQAALGDIIGIPQGEVSKALNGKRRFQLDEVVRIADYFHVPVDSLLGREQLEQQEDISPREVCRMILKLCKKGVAFQNIQRKEICYEDNGQEICGVSRENVYPALFFPEFMRPKCDDDDFEFSISGNFNPFNQRINDFIKKVSAICDAQNKGCFDETMAEDLINKYLEDLPG